MAASSLEPVSLSTGLNFLPVGAHVVSDGVSFRIWAPDHEKIRVVTGAEGSTTRYIELSRENNGFFTGRDESGRAGDLYWFQVDGTLIADPASRFQPAGVEGPSQVVDPEKFRWQANDWQRPPLRGRVIYELHVGAFTPEGTFAAAMSKLDALADLGVNAIELMPLGDFPGRWNWGYDGVLLFAPARCYGPPDALRELVDAAHARGIAIVIDVVYNHFGPSGNVLPRYSRHYMQADRHHAWGQVLNFDGENSGPVRQFFLQNACMWFDEFRVDGLRLDAVHAIEDRSSPHIVAEIAAAAHSRGGFVIGEDERNDARLISRNEEDGWNLDGVWADDFHHTVRVALTGEHTAHFAGYRGTPDEWVDTLRHGWHYRGQVFPVSRRARGTASEHVPRDRFVYCISNHDQVGNRPLGDRLHKSISGEQYRAVSMLLCLVPYTPMLFMGQEWGATAPFPYFTDLPGELGERMRESRLNEFRRNQADYDPDTLARMPDPQAEDTFRSAKIGWGERDLPSHAAVLALYRECLRLRAREPIFHAGPRNVWESGRVGEAGVALRGHDAAGDWLVVTTVANGSNVAIGNDPITRAQDGRCWRLVLASNERRFGGAADAPSPTLLTGPGTAVLREFPEENRPAGGVSLSKAVLAPRADLQM